jgi:hypothetical protein
MAMDLAEPQFLIPMQVYTRGTAEKKVTNSLGRIPKGEGAEEGATRTNNETATRVEEEGMEMAAEGDIRETILKVDSLMMEVLRIKGERNPSSSQREQRMRHHPLRIRLHDCYTDILLIRICQEMISCNCCSPVVIY